MNNYDRNLLSILKISVKEQAGYSLKSDSLELMNIVSFFEKNNDSFNKMKAIFYTGLIYEEIYSYKIALLCYYEALNTALELNDTYWIAYLHGKIGLMYISEYDHIQSQFHLSESNEYLERINIENFDLGFCIQAAKTIMYKGEPSRSIIYFDNVLQRIKKEDIRYTSVLRNAGLAYSELSEWDNAISCLNESVLYENVVQNQAMNKILLLYIYIKKGDQSMALQYKTEIESILSDVKKMNLLDFYYQMDSEYHINSGDLKEALKSIHQSLFYKNNIQEYLSEETPDEKLLSYRNNKLKSENNDLRLRQNYFIYLLFILLVSLSLVYFLLKRKRLHNQYELERRIEILEKIAEEKESDTLELKNILIRDFEITKRIALLKNLHVHKDQSIVDKINNLLIIDDKNSFEIEWNDFYERVNISYDKFYTFLKSHYYNMNEKEIQLCCMMRIGFKTDEIAAVWNQSVFSVQKCRSSIRKKIGTGEGADIISFIETEMNQ